ncbi:hypothetical protein HYT57_04945 [Candidatus Woesearchaeota archaeon]|nr:hypothetical protein [Candidatus Woesearchaeota archaeon]
MKNLSTTFIIIFTLLLLAGCYKNDFQVNDEINDNSIEDTLINPVFYSDSGEFELTVSDIINKDDGDYAEVTINQVLSYSRDENAQFKEIEQGDVMTVYLNWGSGEADTKIEDLTYDSRLPGLKVGDNIKGAIAGCPDNCNGGKGWTLFFYKKI